jgi:hypothetical protein
VRGDLLLRRLAAQLDGELALGVGDAARRARARAGGPTSVSCFAKRPVAGGSSPVSSATAASSRWETSTSTRRPASGVRASSRLCRSAGKGWAGTRITRRRAVAGRCSGCGRIALSSLASRSAGTARVVRCWRALARSQHQRSSWSWKSSGVGEAAAGLEARLDEALQPLDEPLDLGIARRAEVPAERELAEVGGEAVGREAVRPAEHALGIPDRRLRQTAVFGRRPSSRRQRFIPRRCRWLIRQAGLSLDRAHAGAAPTCVRGPHRHRPRGPAGGGDLRAGRALVGGRTRRRS